MAIILPYTNITTEQEEEVRQLLSGFEGEVAQCSLHHDSAQIVLNDSEITPQRGQQFLDRIIEILKPNRWGTDLPRRRSLESAPISDAYTSRYNFEIPFDPDLD